jgi:GT2 family glycosyltransferase
MTESPTNSTVAAVVVTFNRKDLLCQCLDGILSQSRPVDALFVIDNASTDGTAAMISERYADRVRYVRMETNIGGAGGFHHGMKLAYDAGFEYLWIMDDDVLPASACLQFLLEGAKGARVVSPLHLSEAGDIVEVAQIRVDGRKSWARETYVSHHYKELPLLPPTIDLSSMSFEGPLIHRSVIEIAGLPRADFFILFDDTEYSIRVSTLDLGPILCITAGRMTRLQQANSGSPTLWRSYHLWRNRLFSLRRYEKKLIWRLAIDAHYFLAYFRAVLLGRAPLRDAKVKFHAWKDSYSNPLRSRYLPPMPRT